MEPDHWHNEPFEVAPKGLAYAIEHGNPTAAIEALTNVLQKTGGNVFKRIYEYEALGIYNRVEGVHKFSPVETTETFLRNYAAELGTLTGNGYTHGLENIAFVNRFGNEPQATWTNQGSATITLMRYSIASTKFYLGLLGKAAQGDINAAMAFSAFSVMTAVQSGGISALPAPVAYILKQGNPQAYKALKQLDEQAPYLNLSKHLGIDIAEKAQPIGGLALGVGYDILNQDLGNATRDFGKVPGDIVKGRPGLATARLIDGLFGFGQLGSIPGVNLTTKRLVKAVVHEVEKERAVTVGGYFRTAVQHLGLTQD